MVKFKENDIYALEIKNNSEKYNGKYIIIIKCSWPDGTIEDGKNEKRLFRFKITKKRKLPTLNEINDLEYVITHFQYELEKYFPGEGIPFEELKKKRDKVKVYPDKYGYLYTCISEIFSYNKNVPEDLIYIGNMKLDLPKHEYIPFTEYGYKFYTNNWNNIIEKIIEKYEDFNLGKSQWYQKEKNEEIKRACLNDIGAAKECEKLINYLEEKGILHEMFVDEEKTEDSLTYVGGEYEDPYEK